MDYVGLISMLVKAGVDLAPIVARLIASLGDNKVELTDAEMKMRRDFITALHERVQAAG